MRETGVCEGGGFSERSPSLALPPEERMAFGGVCFCIVGSACECGRSPIGLVESTAADRAAADMQGGECATSRISQKSHDGKTVMAFYDSKRLPPQREPLCAAAHDGGYSPRRKVAAALSAAVTTTKLIEGVPTFQAEPTMQKQPRQTPAALREKGSGEEGLLSEKPPPPQNSPCTVFPGGSAREGAFLQKGPLPRKLTLFQFSA